MEIRPSADRTLTCRWTYARSRTVLATMSSTSARFPPTCRWMFTAMTAHRMSSLPTRSAISTIASSIDRPSRISDTTRWNSPADGSLISPATWSRAWRKLCPARRELARIDRTSGSCSAIIFCRFLRARTSHMYGITLAAAAITRTKRMFPSSRAPRMPPAMAHRTMSAANSPAFIGNSACSSFASNRALNPLAVASRSPASAIPAGIHEVSPVCFFPPRPIRVARLRRCWPFVLVDRSSTASRNVATKAAPRTSVSQASLPNRSPIAPTSIGREDLGRDRDPQLGQALHEPRTEAGCLQTSAEPAVLVDPGAVVEQEQILEADDVPLHPHELRDVGDAASAVLHACLVDHQVQGRGDLLPDRSDPEVHPGHQHHRLHTGQGVARGVRVDGRDRPVVAGVHGLHHVQRLAATDLPDHDPVRAHAQGVPDQVADRDLAAALDVRRSVFQAHHVWLLEPELRRVLDREDALVVGQERRQHVQRRRLPRAGPPGDQDVQAPPDTGLEEVDGLLGEGPERDQVIGLVRVGGELSDGQACAVDRERWDDRVHAR